MFSGTAAGCSQEWVGISTQTVRSLLTQTKAQITKSLTRSTNDLVIPSFSVLLIIRSKQDLSSSTIDRVSKNNQKRNAQPAPKKPFPAGSRKIIVQPPGQYSTSSLPLEKRDLSREQQSPLIPPPSCCQRELPHCRSQQGIRCSFAGTNFV